jgi:RHS repeat-associated protein
MGWEPIAVIEGGVTYLVRTDHIGRPVFATNTSGVKVWTATYDPFGGVRTTTGTPINARFPGQWFQSESGLHQNWMRDYDPTTGRYLQADPLGLVDGASVYGYALQSPMMYTDPRGESIFDTWPELCARFPHLCSSPGQCAAPGAGPADDILPPPPIPPETETCDSGCEPPPPPPNCADKYVQCVMSPTGQIWDQQYGTSRCGACNLICFAEGAWPQSLPSGQSCKW